LGSARADDAPPRLVDETHFVSDAQPAPGDAALLPSEPPAPNLPTLNSQMTSPDEVIVEPGALQTPAEWPAAERPKPAWQQCRIWQWAPQGMIPYIGRRTPDDQKDRGIGLPIVGDGWRSQPFSVTTFAGVTGGGALMPGHVNQRASFYGGLNFGWDYDHYWGIEKRLGFGALNLTNGNHQPLPDTGLSVTGEYRLMYYPLGDARWRPFLTAGVGWSDFYYNDDRGNSHLDTLGMIPFGLGLKYLWTNRLAARVDLIDEMTFGNGTLSNFHYVAFTAGLEFRYGKRLLHMPWHRKDGS
jgi:hypothetical protein